MAAILAGVVFVILGAYLAIRWVVSLWASANAMVTGVRLHLTWLPLIGSGLSFAFALWLFLG